MILEENLGERKHRKRTAFDYGGGARAIKACDPFRSNGGRPVPGEPMSRLNSLTAASQYSYNATSSPGSSNADDRT